MVDRKSEFAASVEAVEQAWVAQNGVALVAASGILRGKVVELRRRLEAGDVRAADEALDFLEILVLKLVVSPLQGGQLRELARVLHGHATETLKARLLELTSDGRAAARRRAARVLRILTTPTTSMVKQPLRPTRRRRTGEQRPPR
jgi:hypothetical protein